jgi:hypothetical protein
MTNNERTMIERAKLYASADPSDPFAYRRARTHIANGIASFSDKHGQEAYYSAEPYTETRALPDGTEYQATVYRNRYRP